MVTLTNGIMNCSMVLTPPILKLTMRFISSGVLEYEGTNVLYYLFIVPAKTKFRNTKSIIGDSARRLLTMMIFIKLKEGFKGAKIILIK